MRAARSGESATTSSGHSSVQSAQWQGFDPHPVHPYVHLVLVGLLDLLVWRAKLKAEAGGLLHVDLERGSRVEVRLERCEVARSRFEGRGRGRDRDVRGDLLVGDPAAQPEAPRPAPRPHRFVQFGQTAALEVCAREDDLVVARASGSAPVESEPTLALADHEVGRVVRGWDRDDHALGARDLATAAVIAEAGADSDRVVAIRRFEREPERDAPRAVHSTHVERASRNLRGHLSGQVACTEELTIVVAQLDERLHGRTSTWWSPDTGS